MNFVTAIRLFPARAARTALVEDDEDMEKILGFHCD
jgi:hypothetical protein|tara:strand:- start:167 stop:274 length:108 start_codon:yes stop_codon:yes gene_type:complete